jgi:hypothetical protein
MACAGIAASKHVIVQKIAILKNRLICCSSCKGQKRSNYTNTGASLCFCELVFGAAQTVFSFQKDQSGRMVQIISGKDNSQHQRGCLSGVKKPGATDLMKERAAKRFTTSFL